MNWNEIISKIEPDHLLGYLTGAVTVLLLVIVGWLTAAWLSRITRRALERAKVDDERPLYVIVWGSITDVAQ